MSRAYCLTCNEHVHETPGGTCPLGHPVAADGHGPEPWVGFAGDAEVDAAGVRLQHLDSSGHLREHASVGTHHLNGTHNGSVNGSSNGHAGSLAPSSVAFPSVNGSDGTRSNELASEDLTSLLAEALRQNAPEDPPAAPADEPTDPSPSAEGTDSSAEDADWSELASLAAELHLDENVATDDGPGAPAPAPAEPLTHRPEDDARGGDLSASSIDDLLAELTGGTADPAPPVVDVPDEPAQAPETHMATHEVADWDAPPPVAPPPPPATPPPPPAAPTEDAPSWDAAPPSDGIGSAPEPDPQDTWAEPDAATVEEPTPAPTVDLYNFTARGKRVGDAGPALPGKKKRGRKR